MIITDREWYNAVRNIAYNESQQHNGRMLANVCEYLHQPDNWDRLSETIYGLFISEIFRYNTNMVALRKLQALVIKENPPHE